MPRNQASTRLLDPERLRRHNSSYHHRALCLSMSRRQSHRQSNQGQPQPTKSPHHRHGSSNLSAAKPSGASVLNRTIVSTLSKLPPTRKLSPAHLTSIS